MSPKKKLQTRGLICLNPLSLASEFVMVVETVWYIPLLLFQFRRRG